MSVLRVNSGTAQKKGRPKAAFRSYQGSVRGVQRLAKNFRAEKLRRPAVFFATVLFCIQPPCNIFCDFLVAPFGDSFTVLPDDLSFALCVENLPVLAFRRQPWRSPC